MESTEISRMIKKIQNQHFDKVFEIAHASITKSVKFEPIE